jgi:ethanolamine kinase
VSDERVESLRRSALFFVLASELYWCTWAFAQSRISLIEFPYLGYAIRRFDRYLANKHTYSKQVLE